ncbi:MAG: hypothetical protein HKN79_00195 [Flavobacteriales bacterium]|nr:hypothetical protein [Flavobacteriales bacterium]
MTEKFDLFEVTVKRAAEHYELPLEPGAWSKFESALDGASAPGTQSVTSGGSNFLTQFGAAAAFLLGTLIFINQSVDSDSASETHLSETSIENRLTMGEGDDRTKGGSDYFISGHSDSSELEISQNETADLDASSKTNDESEVEDVLTVDEKEFITRINQRLQEKADREEQEASSDKEIEKRSTTRYLGEDFNLGAVKSFSPNNDGENDSFLPSRLKDGDLFKMTITDTQGKMIFYSTEVSRPWEGTDTLGNDVEEGRYSWEVILQNDSKKEIFKGTVRLER